MNFVIQLLKKKINKNKKQKKTQKDNHKNLEIGVLTKLIVTARMRGTFQKKEKKNLTLLEA